MITDLVLYVLAALFHGLGLLLPGWDPIQLEGAEDVVAGAGSALFGLVKWLDWYLPATLAMSLLALSFGLRWAEVGYRAVLWLLTKLHVLGGSS